jgi:hypothetical protein
MFENAPTAAQSPTCEFEFLAASARSMSISAYAILVLQQYGQKPDIHEFVILRVSALC